MEENFDSDDGVADPDYIDCTGSYKQQHALQVETSDPFIQFHNQEIQIF
jgi:hypothetical protein